MSRANLAIGKETLRQKVLERIDKLEAAFDDSLTSRQRKSSIAHELFNTRDTTILSNEDEMRFGEYYLNFRNAVKDKQEIAQRINKAIDSSSNTKLDTAKLDNAEKEQVNLENWLNNAITPSEKKKFENQIRVVPEKYGIAGLTTDWLDSLSTNQMDLARFEKSSASNQPDVAWLKEGYSRSLGTLRFELKRLNIGGNGGASGTLDVRERVNFTGSYVVVGFTVPGKKTFSLDGTRYEIDFLKIGRAGKNPFTMAVYFSISKINSKGAVETSISKMFQ